MLLTGPLVYKCYSCLQTSYPPNIYYKIFTHRPVVDMCANSPKDYSKLASKQSLTKKIHGKIWKDDGSGYYKRVENNGWRLLSAKVSNKKHLFFFSKMLLIPFFFILHMSNLL